MDKKRAIATIQNLYPIDSQYADTNKVGQELLIETFKEVGFNWRDLPEDVLVRYAEKCIETDNQYAERINEKYK